MPALALQPETAAAAPWLDALPIAAAIVDLGTLGLVEANQAYWDVDTSCREAYGRPALAVLAADALAAVQRVGRPVRRQRAQLQGEVEQRDFLVDIVPGVAPAGGTLLTFVETSAAVHANRLLRRQMIDDPLTGLPNRHGFVDLVDAWFVDHAVCGVVVINLARFSRVNDCMGSTGGDELLVTVARRLKSGLRQGDALARTGADEFAVAARLTGEDDDLLAIAQRIEGILQQPFKLSDYEIKVDCATGCAVANGSTDGEQAMRHAQLALKHAKVTRQAETYQPSKLVHARRRFAIETELRRAVERAELELRYQPIVALATRRVIGFEALCRWTSAELGPVSPVEFVSVAEETGLIVPLGRWVLEQALATLAGWDRAAGRALPCYVAVNCSPVEVLRDDLGLRVADALGRTGVGGQRLSIELTESTIVADPITAARILGDLKEQQAIVAMDDFGTGYSNLAAIRRLPIDVLKIDRSLVGSVLHDGDKAAIVRAILSLAAALGLRVTAEGIETEELGQLLARFGCAAGQGYLYAKPLTADEAYEFAWRSLPEFVQAA